MFTLNASENYEKRKFYSSAGDSINYRILMPKNYNPTEKYPVILFLHGAGERGSDNELQLKHGSHLFVDEQIRNDYPAIVVFPQCSPEGYWSTIITNNNNRDYFSGVYKWPSRDQELAMELFNHCVMNLSVDKSRLYIIGLSMGAFGTYEILARHPHIFAAAIPICGGGNLDMISRYAEQTAMWITHGDEDLVVPVEYSRSVYAELKKYNSDVKYTEYKGVGHDSWDNTFEEPELLKWLFSKQRDR